MTNLVMGKRRKKLMNYASPLKLFVIASDFVVSFLTKVGSKFSIEDVSKIHPFVENLLSQLPRSIQFHILKEAELTLDTPTKVTTLLAIWISILNQPVPQTTVSTPRYLCKNKFGRLLALNQLIKNSKETSPQCLALNMYSFYQHPDFALKNYLDSIELGQGSADASLMLDSDEHFLLGTTIETFRNLETLVLPSVCDDAILFVITSSCTKLKMLDISFSSNVTDLGMRASFGSSICACNNLEQIYLEGSNITSESILLLLKKLQKLEVVESSYLGRALDLLAKQVDEVEYLTRFDLKKVTLPSNHRDLSYNLSHLSQLCPKVEDMILPNFHRDLQLSELSKLDHLSHLYLGEIPLNILSATLEKAGSNLKSLRYTNFSEFVDIDFLLSMCPHLDTIGISAGCLINSSRHNSPWPDLKCIYLNIHALISKPIWQEFFRSCPGMEFLDMTPADTMTDSTIQEICQDYPVALKQIKTFVIRGRHCAGDIALTEKTIQFLASHCKKLSVVGNCVTWSISANPQFGEYIYLQN